MLWWVAGGIAAVAVVLVLLVAFSAAAGRQAGAPVTVPAPSTSATSSPVPTESPTLTQTPEPGPTVTSPPAPGTETALAQLAGLEVVSGYADAPYDRDRFGQRWADVDRNGCDTRNDILGRDLQEPVFKAGTNECKVLGGILTDPYDGGHVDFVSGADTSVLVQIDHVVALAWAWHHGAEHWTDDERTAFANDPRNLVAASERMNQEKSAFGPSEWLPPVAEFRCGYIESVVEVLVAYDLGINADDKAAAQAVLERC